MKWARTNRRNILWTVGLVWVAWFFVSSASFFQECVQAKQNADSENAFYESVSHFLIVLGIIRGCTGHFIHENGDAITALATVLLSIITYLLVKLGREQSDTAHVQLRAYVKLSHHPPGIEWDGNDIGRFSVLLRIKNHGQTPARITNFSLNAPTYATVAALEPEPPYTNTAERGAFLVADDAYSHTIFLRISRTEHAQVMAGTLRLAVFGFVDYIDQFGDEYRGGYGRWYEPARDNRARFIGSDEDFLERNNLTYIEDPRYNYDALRTEIN